MMKIKNQNNCIHLLVQNSWYSPSGPIFSVSHFFCMCPSSCGALRGLQSSRKQMIPPLAASTSGCVVLNLPARPTDKPQWWIRGVSLQSLSYLLQRSSFSCGDSVYVCVSWFFVSVLLCREDGVWGEWAFGGALTARGKLLVGVENWTAEV